VEHKLGFIFSFLLKEISSILEILLFSVRI
jgi:hypothetical protein